MEEGHTEGVYRAEQVTVSQAAKILRVHRNTIHNYIKQGRIRASKVVEGGREYYLIEGDSLPNVQKGTHEQTLDAQPSAEYTEIAVMLSHRLEDLVQRYGQELGSVREELGAERVRREQAEQERDELRRRLESLQEMRDALKTGAEPAEGTDTPPQQGEPETAISAPSTPERRSSWWRRFFGFEDRGSG